jgi:signal transduction histidine kinase
MPEGSRATKAQEKMAFFGRITASLSHEMKNVLATINEFSGLLGDLLYAADRGRPLDHNKLRNISRQIIHQVARAEELIRRLNRFSHSVDLPQATCDIRELIMDLTTLTNRFAMLSQVKLERRLPEVDIERTIDPFGFQQAVFLAIDLALGAATDQRVVTVGLADRGSGFQVIVQSADPLPALDPGNENVALLQKVVAELQGRVEWTSGQTTDSIVIWLP